MVQDAEWRMDPFLQKRLREFWHNPPCAAIFGEGLDALEYFRHHSHANLGRPLPGAPGL